MRIGHRTRAAAIVGLVLAACTAPSMQERESDVVLEAVLRPSDVAARRFGGFALAGDLLVVSTWDGERHWLQTFERGDGDWLPANRIDPPDGWDLDPAIATDGQRIAVAAGRRAPGHTIDLFERHGDDWRARPPLTANARASFADDIAIEGPTIALGRPLADESRGVVLLFEQSVDGPVASRLSSPKARPGEDFGGVYAYVETEEGLEIIERIDEPGDLGRGFASGIAASGSVVAIGAAWDRRSDIAMYRVELVP